MRFLISVIVVLMATAFAWGREWNDSTGEFSLEAEYQGLENKNAVLKKPDDTVIKVPLDKLSEKDRDYIELAERIYTGKKLAAEMVSFEQDIKKIRSTAETTAKRMLLEEDAAEKLCKRFKGRNITLRYPIKDVVLTYPQDGTYGLRLGVPDFLGGMDRRGLPRGGAPKCTPLSRGEALAIGKNSVLVVTGKIRVIPENQRAIYQNEEWDGLVMYYYTGEIAMRFSLCLENPKQVIENPPNRPRPDPPEKKRPVPLPGPPEADFGIDTKKKLVAIYTTKKLAAEMVSFEQDIEKIRGTAETTVKRMLLEEDVAEKLCKRVNGQTITLRYPIEDVAPRGKGTYGLRLGVPDFVKDYNNSRGRVSAGLVRCGCSNPEDTPLSKEEALAIGKNNVLVLTGKIRVIYEGERWDGLLMLYSIGMGKSFSLCLENPKQVIENPPNRPRPGTPKAAQPATPPPKKERSAPLPGTPESDFGTDPDQATSPWELGIPGQFRGQFQHNS